MTTPMLEVRELAIDMNLHGGKRTIVSNVSLTIARGEVVGLIGESGSGKSMTARAIVANLPNGARATGSVLFDGVQVLVRHAVHLVARLIRLRRQPQEIAHLIQREAQFSQPSDELQPACVL